MTTTRFRGSKRELKELIRSIPAILAGTQADVYGITNAIMVRIGNATLTQIYRDFLTKSRGGAGRDGISWAPLAESTIKRRLAKVKGKRAKASKYGGKVDIGRDTGRMLRSLAAGVEDRPSGADGQVLRVSTGEVTVGTNVPYAKHFHEGTPRQPARLLWPGDGLIPDAWWPFLIRAAGRGIREAVAMVIARGGR